MQIINRYRNSFSSFELFLCLKGFKVFLERTIPKIQKHIDLKEGFLTSLNILATYTLNGRSAKYETVWETPSPTKEVRDTVAPSEHEKLEALASSVLTRIFKKLVGNCNLPSFCLICCTQKPSTKWWHHQVYLTSLLFPQSFGVVHGSGGTPRQTNKLLTRWPWLKAESCRTPGLMRSVPPPGCAWPVPAGSSSTPSCWSCRPGWSRLPAGSSPRSRAGLEHRNPSTEPCLSMRRPSGLIESPSSHCEIIPTRNETIKKFKARVDIYCCYVNEKKIYVRQQHYFI